MTSFIPLARAFADLRVRYVLIGVAGANMHAHAGGVVFTTQDRDLLLPPNPENLVLAWQACEACGLELLASGQPLDRPRDLWLAERVVWRSALTKAVGPEGLHVDLTLVMAGFTFDEVWREQVTFDLDGVAVPVARLMHIVTSKAAVGRPKDHLFLATHADALKQLLGPDDAGTVPPVP